MTLSNRRATSDTRLSHGQRGQLITPFVPRTAQEEYRSTPKVVADNINADLFQADGPGNDWVS